MHDAWTSASVSSLTRQPLHGPVTVSAQRPPSRLPVADAGDASCLCLLDGELEVLVTLEP